MSHFGALFAALVIGLLFAPVRAKAARAATHRPCGEIRYLGHGAEWWHFQYVSARRGWRRADAHGQRHPERYRQHGCGRLTFRHHGPEFWHYRLVVLSRRARAHRLTRAARVARLALRYIGVPYRWGGASPRTGFDCSGLVQYVYRRVGVQLPRTTWDQMRVGRRVSRSHLRPGDVVFFNGGEHEGIYLRAGRIVSAPHTGAVVHVIPLALGGSYYTARRFR